MAVLLGAACVAVACAGPPPSRSALGDEIAIGPYAIRITRAAAAPSSPPPISTFRHQAGKKGIVVSVYWRTLDGLDAMQRRAFIESFLENQLSIADADGDRTEAFGAMERSLMLMQDPGSNWRDWVVVFHVPEASYDMTLLVNNPEPREGQSAVTAVPLGL